MATLLFLILKATRDLNFQYDLYVFCFLLALEGPGYIRILVYLLTSRR